MILTFLFLTVLTACSGSDDAAQQTNTGNPSGSGDFPNQPIQMIVSYSAGAATDTQARILAQYAVDVFGQPVVIVNMEGAGGSVGWNHFSKVDPNGYTIAAYNLPHVLSKPLVENTEYTPETFIPLANWGYDPVVFGVLPNSPYQTIDDLIEAAKSNPEKITIGNAGLYVGQHLAILMLEEEAGIKFQNIPFDGAADAQAALLGGTIDVQAGNLSDMYRLVDQVRILAVAAEERHKYLPDVPTFMERGYNVVMSTDRGVAAVDGTPPEVVERLTDGFLEIMNREDFQADMEQAGADLLIMGGEELQQEFEQRAKMIKDLLTRMGHVK
jgi:tripartite-type tricarboxylate transporter receptor subunit TctC